MMKRALVLLVAGLGFAASQAMAGNTAPAEAPQAVKLSDAELDNITAGSATVVLILLNPGNHVAQPDQDSNVVRCINCLPNPFQRAGGVVGITRGDGTSVTVQPIGAARKIGL